jgi:hypothetical protein
MISHRKPHEIHGQYLVAKKFDVGVSIPRTRIHEAFQKLFAFVVPSWSKISDPASAWNVLEVSKTDTFRCQEGIGQLGSALFIQLAELFLNTCVGQVDDLFQPGVGHEDFTFLELWLELLLQGRHLV